MTEPIETDCDAGDGRPMTWAVRRCDLQPVYVGDFFDRSLTGLACDCLCPGCGSQLLAVNAGQPAEHYLREPGAPRPHFRHHTGHQRNHCRVSVARLAALQLLATSDVLDLPAPAGRATAVGASGFSYTKTALGSASRVRVVRTSWLDQQRAVLELDDGRSIALVLVGSIAVDSPRGIDGVLGIEVDDPDVANLSRDELLSRIRLSGSWLRWMWHKDQEALDREAHQSALQEADNSLDLWPQELPQPQGLSPLQRSESILHWALKNALAGLDSLWVPGKSGLVQMTDDEGYDRSAPWSVPGSNLTLKDVRLETRLGNVVPDIVCTAITPKGILGHPNLMIEVAVTHRVDPEKRKKIIAAGYACVELNAARLSVGGRVPRSALPNLIRDRGALEWVYHPAFLKEEASARLALKNRLAAERSAAEAGRLVRAFLAEAPIEDLFSCLHACLANEWVRGPSVETLHQGMLLRTDDVVDAIGRHRPGFVRAPGLMGQDGVLALIVDLHSAPRTNVANHAAMEAANRLMCARSSSSQFITLVLAAFNAFRPHFSPTDNGRRQQIRREVWHSVKQGERHFARPQIYDDFVLNLFPALVPYLSPEGTDAFAVAQGRMVDAEKRRIERESAERAAAARRLVAKEEEALRIAEERSALITRLSSGGWQAAEGHPHDVEQAQHIVKHVRCSYVQRDTVIKQAWEARAQGKTVEEFYQALNLIDVHALREVSHLLSEAYIKLAG